ncbi:MAG TPA: DMT family transporter [Bacilli bacterium]|nr:DMT family transporter [Bacilli bacterium]
MNRSKLLIYFSLVLVMFFWGMNVIALKVLVTSFPPIMLTAFRVFIAGVLVTVVVLFKNEIRRLTRREWGYLLLSSLFGIIGHHIFLTYGLVNTTASNSSIILALLPLTTALLARVLLGEQLSRSRFLGIILGFIGVMFIVLQGELQLGKQALGDFYIFLCMLFQGLSFITIKNLSNTLNSRQLTAMMLIIGSIAMFFISLFVEASPLQAMMSGTSFAWLLLIGSAVLATAVGQMIYNRSIHQLGASEAAVFINLAPFFGLIGSVVFLGEEISWKQMAGFIFIVIGVILGAGVLDKRIRRRKKLKQAKTSS